MKTTTDNESKVAASEVEAALQKAHQAMEPRQRRIWPWVIAAQLTVLVLGYFSAPYLTTRLVFDQEAMEAEEALIAERARAYREEERAARERLEIHEEHAAPLKRQEREKRRQEVLAHVYELEEIAKRLREERDARLGDLLETSPDETENFETKLEESLRKFSEATDTVESNELITKRHAFDEAARELIDNARKSREKANSPTGLNPQDRERLSEQLASTEASLLELQDNNRDVWSGEESGELNKAQAMANLLKSLPRQINHARRQVQSADSRLTQQRKRYHDEIKREVDRFTRSHQGLLAHKSSSPKVESLARALENLKDESGQQKEANEWKQAEYEDSYRKVKAAANEAKQHIEEVRNLGKQRETLALGGLLNNQLRQADTQKNGWEQLERKQTGEAKKNNQSLSDAIDKVARQWEKTKKHLPDESRKARDQEMKDLLKEARNQTQPAAAPPGGNSVKEHGAKSAKLANSIKEEIKEDQQGEQESGRLQQALQALTTEAGKHAETLKKHEAEKNALAKRIEADLRKARNDLKDRASKAAPALVNEKAKPASLKELADDLAGLKKQAEELSEAARTKKEDLGKLLAARSKALSEASKAARELHRTQTTRQNGITRDEAKKLERSLTSLEKSLGLRHSELLKQAAATNKNIDREKENLQKSLDAARSAAATAAELKSPEAKKVAATVNGLPEKADEILKATADDESVTTQVSRAEKQTKDWLQRAKGEAPVRQVQMAETSQTLRELSEAMNEAGLTRGNSNAAATLLDEGPLELPEIDPASLEEAVAAAEELHERIEEDFQTARAADIAARTGQSFEQLQRLANSLEQKQKEIAVPEADPEVETVGDLREYRKAMDKAVLETESLAQNARTLQRQVLGEGDSALAQALKQGRASGSAQGDGISSHLNIGVDPRRRRKGSNTWHQMTFEDIHIPTGRLQIDKIKAEALPGRRFTGESTRRGWFYVDTWYVIGPWENFGKVNWSNVHPPELEIDLASAYSDGKGGRELRWQFTQHPAIRCDVPDETTNSSYYAYTELYFDQPREMLVVMASNDSGKLWIDDQVVWQDNGMSSWNLDEAFRRVRFKKGFSKILMRVENGPQNCQFSLLLCHPDL